MLGGLRRLFGQGSDSATLEPALLKIATEVWDVEAETRGKHYPGFEWTHDAGLKETTDRRAEESLRRLLSRWPPEELTRLAADMLFGARSWFDRYAWDHTRPEAVRWLQPAQGRIMVFLLLHQLKAHPPADLADRLHGRMAYLFEHPHDGPPVPFPNDNPYPPTMRTCLELLQSVESPAATALVHDLVRGALDHRPEPCNHPSLVHGAWASGYDAFSGELTQALPWMLQRIWRAGLLDDRLLEHVLKRFTRALAQATSPAAAPGRPNYFYRGLDEEFAAAVRPMIAAMVRRWAEHLEEANAPAFKEVARLEGAWYLLKACEHVERLGYRSLLAKDNPKGGSVLAAVARMCNVLRAEEDTRQVVAALRTFKESTLLAALPIGRQYQDLICEALGWDGAHELIRLIQGVARFEQTESLWDRDVRNSPDPTDGVVDRGHVLDLRARLGEKRFDAVVKLYAERDDGAKHTLYLIQTALGQNRSKVLDGFAKRNQLAVKALGLLPIEHPDETLRRYVALRQFAKEASKFGMQRQANERAAAEVALANLALNAGYRDATRLEWAMEDRLGRELGADGREWAIDERCVVKLETRVNSPELTAYKDGKPLRTLPAAVKQHPDYDAMKEAVAQLRSQARRYRAALEGAMCRGEELASEELAALARNPAARKMLAALLLLDGGGRVGLYESEGATLVDPDGERHQVSGPLRIAHPLDLHERGALATWQRELVRRRVVQPFKQAFRELYVVTAAEEETSTFSNRFAGQVVDAKQAARLLSAEGWDCTGEDFPRRTFHRHGVTAHLTFAESYHYMGELESLVVDRVLFVPTGKGHWWTDDGRMPLEEVPPLLFSEVMRDVDLVVSVAQYVGGAAGGAPAPIDGVPFVPSPEIAERRGDLVRTLAEDLSLKGVTVDGHFVRVKGKLADYRVHLGSAVIHVEPGAYLCVVPARWGQKHDRLFLPFDAEDLKTSEVVSKVLLLSEDDKIKDESILGQIRARR